MIDYPAAPLNTVDTHQKQQRILSDLCERGFSVIEDYFSPQFCHLLRHESQDFWQTNQFHPATVGQGKQQRLENSVRGDHILWLDRPAQGSGLRHYLSSLDNLKQHLNQGLFLGLQDHEAHLCNRGPRQRGFHRRLRQHHQPTKQRGKPAQHHQKRHDAWGGQHHIGKADQKEAARIDHARMEQG